MEIRQLEYFRAIVDAGTISGAARELHMTQPPLSYQMKMLEEELQVPLFIRGMKHITLTEAGKTLYEQAGKILMLSEVTNRENRGRLFCILQTIAGTGMRIGELKYLTAETLEERKIRIDFKGKVRIILIPRSLLIILKDYCRKHKIKEGSIFRSRNGR